MFNPCCCSGPCDGPCVIHSDKFDRANSGTIGTGWTEDAGAWEIKDNTLYTEDSNAKVTWSPDPFSFSDAGANVVVRFKGNTNGDEISVWIATSYYIKFTIGPSGTAQIYDSTNMLLYQCSVAMTAGDWQTMSYFTGDGIFSNSNHATLYVNGTCILSVVLLTLTGTRIVAIETGTITDSAAIDFLCINRDVTGDAACPSGLTWPWVKGTPLVDLEVVIAGAINNGTVDYTPLNGTYNVSVNPGEGTGRLTIPTQTFTIGPDTFSVDIIECCVVGCGYSHGSTWWEISASFLDEVTEAIRFSYTKAFGNSATLPIGAGTTPSQTGLCDDTVDLEPYYNGASEPDIGTAQLTYTI